MVSVVVSALSLTAATGFAFWPFSNTNAPAKQETQIRVNQTDLDRSTKFIPSFAPVVKKVAPSVVSLSTSRTVKMDVNPFSSEPFLRRFFGVPDDDGSDAPSLPIPSKKHERKEIGIGSGVIISPDGYILTNNHVVEGATDIKVTFSDGRSGVEGKIIGTDPKTDIAVIKVDEKNLPAITIGDSDHLEVGDLVLAVGNPFGLSQTVTMGIVSALGRYKLGIIDEGYEDFIQTDASINPGNSGGALTDTEGRLVGLNTAIFSRTGGNQGIGFAVPINLARNVMEQIISKGRVIRGFLGVSIQEVDEDLAKEFGLPDTKGALVGDVLDGPAKAAKIQPGDVIVKLDGQPVDDPSEFRLKISQTPPGTKVKLGIIRNGKPMDVTVTLTELPDKIGMASDSSKTPEKEQKAPDSFLEGVKIGELDEKTRHQLNVPPSILGVVVQDVDSNLEAVADMKIRPGDVIIGVNRASVKNVADAMREIKKVKGDKVILRIWRGGAAFFAAVPLKADQE